MADNLKKYVGNVTDDIVETITNCSGITNDSRNIRENYVFVAIKGFYLDGHKYIGNAIENGAKIIFYEDSQIVDDCIRESVIFIPVKNTRKVYSLLCKTFYSCPDDSLKVIGVSGTNGKTTTTYMVKKILESAGNKVGIIGTIEYNDGKKSYESELTTPEPDLLFRLLSQMKNNGVTHVVLELSSHALELDRVFGLSLDGFIFTNLTQDHLDFHKTMNDYFEAKMKAFDYLTKKDSFSIINSDSPYGRKALKKLMKSSDKAHYTYSLNNDNADFYAQSIISNHMALPKENSFSVTHKENKYGFEINMTGVHNIYNATSAFACCYMLGGSGGSITKALKNITVPGRFETFNIEGKGIAVVDFAHTGDALENTLKTAKKMRHNRLITVFGCGGNRDGAKRYIMGQVAANYSDFIIITNDNPRNEHPKKIALQIQEGIESVNFTEYIMILDRERAINEGLSMMEGNDILLIAGKGHEQYQIIAEETEYFSDQYIIKTYIKNKL